MAIYFLSKCVGKTSAVGKTGKLITMKTPENVPKGKLKTKQNKKFHFIIKKKKKKKKKKIKKRTLKGHTTNPLHKLPLKYIYI